MTSTTYFPATKPNWFLRSESWLDRRGKGAWIALMVAGFIAFWPIGLTVLGYMLVTRRFSSETARDTGVASRGSTGNTAFDAYRADTISRLEEEQEAFQAFLERLREAKDKAEFDQFMEDRARRRGDEAVEDRAA